MTTDETCDALDLRALAEDMCVANGGVWGFLQAPAQERYLRNARAVIASEWLAARIEQARAEGAAEVVARVEAIAHSAKANTYRDEACRGVVQLPYASNRYVRLLDDIRAALRGDA